ncbi:phosphate ABC transporter permease PstA [uncultured Pseudoramibacter sp.]|uniref:phosphate ABC transporter permease PstA n=1 Tax=uncultured Pseudoramibacter sp. TaxID=1623493 RepID=UPI0025EA552D|nr:phosphate ABC transporter permease PstA [uncultured Pseudoramibacter sp.]
MKAIVWIAGIATMAILIFLVLYILINGLPHIKPSLFSIHYNSQNVSLFPAMINTLTMVGLSLLFAGPIGIFSAVYLAEYAKRGSKFVAFIRLTSETLTGIPSIIFGIFGMLMFVDALHMGYSLLAGALTLALMILPVIMRATEEALHAVPDSYREGSFGLGAGKLRTIFKVVLPSAAPGILAGVILGIGRVVGETAALIYTAGTVAQIPKNIMGSGRTLAVHMYSLWTEGMNVDQSYATAVILLVVVIILNFISDAIAKCVNKVNE